MNNSNSNPKQEFEAALAYYKQTIWNHVHHLPLTGGQYSVALRAWQRLNMAQRHWFKSLDITDQKKAMATGQDIEAIKPRRLERDDSIAPELLATVVAARLGTKKPKSIHTALEEAHRILIASHDFLKKLPAQRNTLQTLIEATNHTTSFEDIIKSSGMPERFPLVPTIQTSRNGGKLTIHGLKQALKRHAIGKSEEIQREIHKALKNKAVSCPLLEQIRWQRFRKHFKSQ